MRIYPTSLTTSIAVTSTPITTSATLVAVVFFHFAHDTLDEVRYTCRNTVMGS